MFTNGVVASVKIYRGDDADSRRNPAVGPARVPDAVFRGGPLRGADSRAGRDASRWGPVRSGTGSVAAYGPAPQEGSKT